jgi:hypothetical protein
MGALTGRLSLRQRGKGGLARGGWRPNLFACPYRSPTKDMWASHSIGCARHEDFISNYNRLTAETDRFNADDIVPVILGLFGEVGGVLKKTGVPQTQILARHRQAPPVPSS